MGSSHRQLRLLRAFVAVALSVVATLVLIVGASASADASPATSPSSSCTISWNNASGGNWSTTTNWTPNGTPGSTDDVCITLNGTYNVVTPTTAPVSIHSLTIGGTSGSQKLQIASTCSVQASVTTSTGTTINANGIVELTNGDGCGNNATLTSPITNAGTILSTLASGGSRFLQGNLTNTGTIAINQNTSFNAASTTLDNQGTIAIADAKALSVLNGASFTNDTGGAINATGSGLVAETAGTFTQGAGTTSGTKPVVLDNATLGYVGTGASAIAVHGNSSLTGNLGPLQTLTLESTSVENAFLTAASGYTNAGNITLTNGDGAGNNATLITSAGTLTNSGTILTTAPVGGARTIQGNLTNTGHLTINQSTSFNAASTTLDNKGTIAIADAKALSVLSGASVTNDTGGAINATGSGLVAETGGTFTQGAGTTSGTKPVVLDNATLGYVGTGASAIAVHGTNSVLTGNLGSSQNLTLESTCGENVIVSASASYTNAGNITLTNGEGCGTNESLVLSTGTLTNSGTITAAAAVGGQRNLQGNLTNTGNLTINRNASFTGFTVSSPATLDNRGTIAVADGVNLTLSNFASLTNTSGTIGATSPTGSGFIFETHSGTFTENGGTTTGAAPVYVDDSAISYTGSGASSIIARGSDPLNGNVVAGQTLTLQSTCSENAVVTAAGAFTNGGTIVLTNGDGCGNNETLNFTAGLLTNSGAIHAIAAIGGQRNLQGSLTNTGTVTIDRNSSFLGAGTLLNQGTIAIADGMALSAPNGPTITNGQGGAINASGIGTGFLSQLGGIFNESGGTTTGTNPVFLDDQTLNYTASGASTIHLRGNSALTGNVSKGQTLQIESTVSENATVTAPGSFGNAGTIILTNGDGAGNNATLTLTGVGTLTNTGTFESLEPRGGSRALNGNLSNAKTLILDAGTNLLVGGTFTQTSAGSVNSTIHDGSSVGVLNATGAVTIGGAVAPTVTGTKPTVGQSFTFLHGSSLTGTFSKVTKGGIGKKGLYFDPTYTATSASLLVTQAANTAPHSAARGSSFPITGTNWAANDSIQIAFTDSLGVKTTYTTITANPTGAFSTNVTIPLGAATGVGKITITSLFDGAVMTDKITIS